MVRGCQFKILDLVNCTILLLKGINVPVPGKRNLYPYVRLLPIQEGICDLAGWDLYSRFTRKDASFWNGEWATPSNYQLPNEVLL